MGTGTVTITTRVNKRLQTLVLTDVYLVPDLRRNLLSISCLRNHYKILFNRGIVQITAFEGHCVAIATYHDGLYSLMQYNDPIPSANIGGAHKENPLMIWHRRLGHVGFRVLKKLASLGKLGSLTN